MLKKDTVINLEPCDSSIRKYEGGFTWEFVGVKKDGGKKIIRLKFERWWLSGLSRDLREVLKEEIAELNRLSRLCGFKDD